MRFLITRDYAGGPDMYKINLVVDGLNGSRIKSVFGLGFREIKALHIALSEWLASQDFDAEKKDN